MGSEMCIRDRYVKMTSFITISLENLSTSQPDNTPENIMGINLIKTKAPMLAALFVTLVRM